MEMMIKKDDHIQYFQNSYNHITIGFSYNWQPVRIQGLVLDELKKKCRDADSFRFASVRLFDSGKTWIHHVFLLSIRLGGIE